MGRTLQPDTSIRSRPAEPGDKVVQAVFQGYLGVIAEQTASFRQIGASKGHITGNARLLVDDRFTLQCVFEHAQQVANRHWFVMSEIDRFAHHVVGLERG